MCSNMDCNTKQKDADWLSKWREEYKDVLDDVGIDVTPSRECPDPNKNPWE